MLAFRNIKEQKMTLISKKEKKLFGIFKKKKKVYINKSTQKTDFIYLKGAIFEMTLFSLIDLDKIMPKNPK